jgi:very-short-patch-repair endonuclease
MFPVYTILEFGGAGGGAFCDFLYNKLINPNPQNRVYEMTHRRTSPKAFANAHELRRHPTEAESRLWHVLRMHRLDNVHFRRQHAIGPYIVDFCAPRIKLVIEVDGSQHLDQQEHDAQRTAFLAERGFRVIRFWNTEVMNQIDEVVQVVLEAIAEAKE